MPMFFFTKNTQEGFYSSSYHCGSYLRNGFPILYAKAFIMFIATKYTQNETLPIAQKQNHDALSKRSSLSSFSTFIKPIRALNYTKRE